jgi:hypothetical protein
MERKNRHLCLSYPGGENLILDEITFCALKRPLEMCFISRS